MTIPLSGVLNALENSRCLGVLFETVCTQSPKRWAAIRSIHAILDRERINEPYPVDWTRIFTPIERDAWHALRHYGVPMRPQYPVGKFFVDFANPVHRIALECDGKAWHDARKDRARDQVCADLGWTVFRASGVECSRNWLAPFERYETKEEMVENRAICMDWLNQAADGLVFAISRHYFGSERSMFPFSSSDIIGRLSAASSTFTG